MSETTLHHMSLSIEGFLRNFKRKKMTGFMSDDDGNPMSDKAIRTYLAECQLKGWKVLPMSSECEGFDHFGGGCPSHPCKKD